jgi:hypothetical protein
MSKISEELKSAIEEVCRRSSVDKQFRLLALTNPHDALNAVTAVPLSSSVNIQFVENKSGYQTIVLPDPVDGVSELAEEELEQVAGGVEAGPTATVGIKIGW